MRSRRRRIVSVSVVGLSALVSGVGIYALLILVARNLEPADYSDFSFYWALAITVGLGVYFPLEQETAREQAGSTPAQTRPLARTVATVSAVVTAAILLALAVLLPFAQALASPAVVLAIGASTIAFGVQFPVRGLLSGGGHTTAYSAVIGLEGLLRVILPGALVVAGLSSTLGFALATAIATMLSVAGAIAAGKAPFRARTSAGPVMFSGRFLRLVVAALAVQLLLNSAILIAKATAPEHPALAGQLLACITLARIPVFAYQVMQVLYLPRMARAHADGRHDAARRTLLTAGVLASFGGILTVAVMGLGGGVLTAVLFGSDLVLETAPRIAIAVGVAVFLVALVLSDGALAIGRHRLVVRSWVTSVGLAAVVVAASPDVQTAVTLPLIVGGIAAALQLLIGLLGGLRTSPPVSP